MKGCINRGFTGIIGFLLGITLFALTSYAGKLLVIGGSDVPSLTKDDVKNIYLGFKRTFPDGTPVRIYVLKESRLKEKFVRDVIGIQITEFRAHWLSKALAGEGGLPKELDENGIIEAVRRERGAVGFVPEGTPLPPGVKVLLEIE